MRLALQEIIKYQTMDPIATKCVSNNTSIEIMDIEYGIENYVVVKGFLGEFHRYKVYYDTDRPYFVYSNGRRYHLDEFERL